jgi:nitrite reductase/ring-hydroxylating ferredoxin subunit
MSFQPTSVQSQWVGSYRRRMAVSVERMYENALDWAHLPYLHSDAFASIELVEEGDWGWRAILTQSTPATAKVGTERRYGLQLTLDREHRRWISSTLDGPAAGSEIWTHVFEHAARDIEIQADFFVPNVPEEHKRKLGRAYQKLYAQLYDEDEAMMLARQAALDHQSEREVRVGQNLDLGAGERLASSAYTDFELAGKRWRLLKLEGDWQVYALSCPHQQGPLDEAKMVDGVVACPWHGYQFDIRSGKCVSGHRCQLPTPPSLQWDQGHLIARL